MAASPTDSEAEIARGFLARRGRKKNYLACLKKVGKAYTGWEPKKPEWTFRLFQGGLRG